MNRYYGYFLALCIMITVAGCSKITGEGSPESNKVNINSIDIDNSTNYKYIFRDEIQKEEMKKSVHDGDYFKK